MARGKEWAMNEIHALLDRLERSGRPVFWQGPVSVEAVTELERLLDVQLSASFRAFLLRCGGGGVEGGEISGIEDDNPSLENRGTVWGDTKRCRGEFGLPPHLVVIFFSDDELCWCMDSSSRDESGETPVVSFSIHSRKVDAVLALSFTEFLKQYVELRI